MKHFECDYLEGAHPQIIKRLMETNMEKTSGYGTDIYCEEARKKIRKACNCPNAEIFFLVGGTQTNATVIDAMLSRTEGVIAADSGHISIHEAGAIEASGHKVLVLPHKNGKLSANAIQKYIENFYNDGNHEHMVFPGMVYISHPTEYGTLYTKKELEEINAVCQKNEIPLFLDGARLGYALMAKDTDVTLKVIANNCDVFYIGGTKVGALFGEAVVFTKPSRVKHFFTVVKQHGALLAKGRLMGIQFDTLFDNNLYFEISKHAIEMADKLKEIFDEKGYKFFLKTPTNQQFIILENEKMKQLSEKVGFSFWQTFDENHTVVRFATSWATNDDDIEELRKIL